MKNETSYGTMKEHRKGCKDVWNAYMCENARFSANDIPFCPTTALGPPCDIITWEKAKSIYKKHLAKKDLDFTYDAFVCFYVDDYKFDGPRGIWHDAAHALKVLRHFAGVITPDFSTYQDFPEPIKIYNTYRMRAFGYWLGKNGISVINNVRWGTPESYRYCFDGIEKGSIISIGTVGGSPRKYLDRARFEQGLAELVRVLSPKTIVVYGSANYPCLEKLKDQGITIVAFSSETAKAFERGKTMSKGDSGYFTGTSGEGKALIDEVLARGEKITASDVIGIMQKPDGQIIWLEKGHLGPNPSGLVHIMDAHERHFNKIGINSSDISDFVLTAVANGEIIGYQGKGTGRPIYQINYNGQAYKVAVTVGDNGYIVGANPRT